MVTAVAAGLMQTRVALDLARPLLMNRSVLEIIMYLGNYCLHRNYYGFGLGTSPADEQVRVLSRPLTSV